MNQRQLLFLPVLLLLLAGCGGKKFKKSPVDELIVAYSEVDNYSIILHDMEVDGTFFKTYKHKYEVIKNNEEGLPVSSIGPWKEVDEKYFKANENNLGMTLCYKKDGELEKQVSPPGYQYVGDQRYGHWQTHNGNSFWAFYGQYMFMSQMFRMVNRPVYRREYDEYRGGYYGSRGYYGPKTAGSRKYGTNSKGTQKERPNFYQRRASRTGSGRSSRGFGGRGSGFGK